MNTKMWRYATQKRCLERLLIYGLRMASLWFLVGPSGSGKTTMIKMVNRLLEPTDGNIYMDGKRIKDYDERELRLSTGYVLQAIALFPNLTVAEKYCSHSGDEGVE